jgi:hypothetical protein
VMLRTRQVGVGGRLTGRGFVAGLSGVVYAA